jgi:uncharacterized protein YybS (DUF2232 family)
MPFLNYLCSKSELTDIIKGSTATIVLFLAYVLLFFAGPLAGIFAPYPVLYYSLKSGKKVGIAIVVIATGILLALDGASAIFYLLQCGIFALLLAEFLDRGMSAVKALTYTLVINLLAVLALTLGYGLLQGVDVNGLIVKGIHSAISQTEVFYQKSGLKGDDLEAIHQALVQTADFVSTAYPALIVVLIGAIAGMNLLLLKVNVNRLPRQPFFGDFSRFRNPDQLIWVLIAAGFVLLINNALVTKTSLNILVVTSSLYFIQGLSITTYFFKRLPIPRFFRVLFYIMLAVQPYLMVVVAALGVFDLWCDFRTPKKQENL